MRKLSNFAVFKTACLSDQMFILRHFLCDAKLQEIFQFSISAEVGHHVCKFCKEKSKENFAARNLSHFCCLHNFSTARLISQSVRHLSEQSTTIML